MLHFSELINQMALTSEQKALILENAKLLAIESAVEGINFASTVVSTQCGELQTIILSGSEADDEMSKQTANLFVALSSGITGILKSKSDAMTAAIKKGVV